MPTIATALRSVVALERELWEVVRAGRETISILEMSRRSSPPVRTPTCAPPNFVAAEGLLADADRFDAAFFGYTPTPTPP
jgi:acyl transferase domain-containing protein